MKPLKTSILLPVIVVLVIIESQLTIAEAGNVRLFDQNWARVDVGDLTAETTVGQLKKIVAKQTGIEEDRLRIATMKDRPLLEDQEQLWDFLSIHEDELNLKICDDLTTPGPIHIDLGKKRFELLVTRDKTLAWLKKEAVGDVDIDNYRVFFGGRELTDDSRTLGEHQLHNGAGIVIFKSDQKFKITVVPRVGNEKKFDITLETSVNDLRKMIEESGMMIDGHLLVILSNLLQEHNKVLRDNTELYKYSMQSFQRGFVVHLLDRLGEPNNKITIFRKKPDGISYFSLLVKPPATLGELKVFVTKYYPSIPNKSIILKLGDELLEGDSRRLSEFDIFPGAWIQVQERKA